MNPQAMSDDTLDTPAPPSVMRATRPFYWSVRREFWESRSITIAPLTAAGVVLFGFLLSIFHLARNMVATLALDPTQQEASLEKPYNVAAIAIILTAFITAIFYCLGALHNERRDRSILFWKSLPVSDLTTVLAKTSIPLLAIPVLVFVLLPALQLIMLVISTLILLANHVPAAPLLTQVTWLTNYVVLLYGVATFTLWYAPVYGWLLLVSGWARRAAFLWAVLPPLALCLIERMAFGTSRLFSLLGNRIGGSFALAFNTDVQTRGTIGLDQLDAIKFLTAPGLWLGLLFAAVCLAAAVRLRNYRGPL